MSKFLFIRFSSLPEIILATPLLRCLKTAQPAAEIHFLTHERFASLFTANPHVQKTHILAHSTELMVHELVDEAYDYVVDLQGNSLSMLVRRKLGKETQALDKDPFREWMLVHFKWDITSGKHLVDRYFDTIKSFTIINDGRGLDYFIPADSETAKQDIPASHHAGYICFAIGADYNTRKYPVENLKAFCELLDHPIILIGEQEDRPVAERVAESDPIKIYNACGKFSIHENADLIRKSKLVIANDNGYLQIAAAFRRPVVSLWGNTVTTFGRSPYYAQQDPDGSGHHRSYDQLEMQKLRCRPCSSSGYDKCPQTHFRCMKGISPERVLEAVKNRL